MDNGIMVAMTLQLSDDEQPRETYRFNQNVVTCNNEKKSSVTTTMQLVDD